MGGGLRKLRWGAALLLRHESGLRTCQPALSCSSFWRCDSGKCTTRKHKTITHRLTHPNRRSLADRIIMHACMHAQAHSVSHAHSCDATTSIVPPTLASSRSQRVELMMTHTHPLSLTHKDTAVHLRRLPLVCECAILFVCVCVCVRARAYVHASDSSKRKRSRNE